ncbi:terminase family protein [Sphingomonas sp. SFZ2018-12]|uniref:DNA-packaging protein n=1 Tax=Sphingomonas sp. SFZ2018-12 TaxID=2683197 RepID=UPI001F0D1E41|nr:terminase family protein [Sphingomonas sp. SFZ2018-12]
MTRVDPAMADRSMIERALLNPDGLGAKVLADMEERTACQVLHDWRWWQRPGQVPPPGDWRVWLVMAGRGFGKTRMGAEWVRAAAEADGAQRIALVGASMLEVRRVMVEGESGLLGIAPMATRPRWEPSIGKLSWANGAVAYVYSAADPEGLRGPQHSLAWADEIAKWPRGEEAWDNLMLTLRLNGGQGQGPRVMATTTPRAVPLIHRLKQDAGVVETQGRTRDNRANLAPAFLNAMIAAYQGTRLGRQELDGELIEDVEGALWTRATIEACRVRAAPSSVRVVVGVDPPAGEQGDACGIVAVALGVDGHGYVVADSSVAGASPERWAAAVAACAARHGAMRVVAEANQGGAMVRSVLMAADHRLPITLVHASHGKAARAEPVATLYESGRVHHVGAFPELEDELCGLVAGGGYAGPGRSPDRADALVWALTELMLGKRAMAGVRVV